MRPDGPSAVIGASQQNSEIAGWLVATGVAKCYRDSGKEVRALEDVTLGVGQRELVAIVGPNGCGKSTLLLTLAGLSPIDAGQILIHGRAPDPSAVGLVFQNYRESLLPWRSVHDNLAFGLEMRGVGRRERRSQVMSFLRAVGVELPLERYPYQLSGGQQQLVSIARSLITAPEILLMDEPFAALDVRARLNMHSRSQEVFAASSQTVCLVSHEIDEAILLADRVLVLSNRPARVLGDIKVPLTRPRRHEVVLTDEFVRVKRAVFDICPMNADSER